MALEIDKLVSDMLGAALPMLKAGASDATSYATTEFKKIAQTIVSIGEQKAAGEVTDDQAKILLDMQTHASRAVLLTLEGLALLTVEAALNAALSVVKTTVNTALGFALIV